MEKAGQVTIFIIIAVVLIAGVVAFFVLREGIDSEKTLSLEGMEVKIYVESCIEDNFLEVLDIVSLQGGYYGIPDKSIEYTLKDSNISVVVPYYYNNRKLSYPSVEMIEEEISLAMIFLSKLCTNVSEFDFLVKIDEGRISAQTTISKRSVSLLMRIPILVSVGESSEIFDKFELSASSHLSEFYFAALEISENSINEEICLNCISDILGANNMFLESTEIEREDSVEIVYYLVDKETNNAFSFANKFFLENEIE